MYVGSGSARVSDQHRQPVRESRSEDERDVPLHAGPGVVRLSASELIGAHVRGSGISANHVDAHSDRPLKAVRVGSVSQRPTRTDNADPAHRHLLIHSRSLQDSLIWRVQAVAHVSLMRWCRQRAGACVSRRPARFSARQW